MLIPVSGLAGQPSGRLAIGVATLGAERLDFQRPSGSTNSEISRAINGLLVEYSPSGEFVPGLASSWTVSPDGKTWDVLLRKGVKWHNGETLTAEDVVFGIERMKRPEISAGLSVSGLTEALERVEAVDPYHVRYHFRVPYAVFPLYADLVPPVPKKFIEKVGDEVFSNEQPVGTGQFKFVKRVKGSEYEFEAFDNYYGAPPRFKTLVIKIIPESAARLAALRTGEIDIAKDCQGEMYQQVKNSPNLGIASTESGGVALMTFAEQYDKASPWSDVRVRRAVAYGIDREAIAKAVFRGEGFPAVFPEGSFAFGIPKDLKPYPYDPAKAKALLALAGYPNGLPGVWDLQTFQSASSPFQPQIAEAAASYLAKIGIKTKLQVMETGAFSAAYTGKKLKGLPISGSGETRFDVGSKNNIWGAKAPGWSQLNNEDTNRLWEQQLVTVDREKRRKILEEAVRIIADEARLVSFVETKSIFCYGPKVKEYTRWRGNIYATAHLEGVTLK
ncbi:MAG: ABC transporter substrate-binding protein [Bryobacteraceae bacterium]